MSGHLITPKTYVKIFLVLMALTALTVIVSRIDLGPLNLPIALVIAVTKASFVLLIFMHVRYSDRLTWIFAAAGIYWFVCILLVLTFSDYLTRGWVPFRL